MSRGVRGEPSADLCNYRFEDGTFCSRRLRRDGRGCGIDHRRKPSDGVALTEIWSSLREGERVAVPDEGQADVIGLRNGFQQLREGIPSFPIGHQWYEAAEALKLILDRCEVALHDISTTDPGLAQVQMAVVDRRARALSALISEPDDEDDAEGFVMRVRLGIGALYALTYGLRACAVASVGRPQAPRAGNFANNLLGK